METMRLGKTGSQVTRVGIGGIPLTRPSEKDAIEVVQRALDLGVNFIDTAVGYGPSEERIGKALAAWAGPREQVILATKSPGRDKATALEHLQISLERLQTDYVDLWQLHNVSNFQVYDQVLAPGGALEAAQEARQTGQVRHIGLSSHNVDVALKAVASGLFETVQFPFNFISDEAAHELIPLARERDVGFIAMKPFAGGHLNDANLALKYVLQFDNVVPDPGVEKVEEIQEIVDIVNSASWELSPQDWQRIKGLQAELGTRFCRQCQYCLPCPEGVNIPMMMIMHGMYKLWSREVFTNWMGQVVETGRACVQCGECEEKCPYQLPIREMIVEHTEFYEIKAQNAESK